MAYTKQIACLANSYKQEERCVAGREYSRDGLGDWIRPVSARDGGGISLPEQRFENGKRAQVLDIVAIEMIEPVPSGHQQENHLIDAEYHWKKEGRLAWSEIEAAVEQPDGPLWHDDESTWYGIRDKVAEDQLERFSRSLYLVRPRELIVRAREEGGDFGPPKRKVRADFMLGDTEYRLSITDPVVLKKVGDSDDDFEFPDAIICVSLTGAWNGYAYKVVASVITPKRCNG